MTQSIDINGLIKKRAKIVGGHKLAFKAADVIRDDLAAIDRALLTDDTKGMTPRSKYKQLFGRSELKLPITRMLASFGIGCAVKVWSLRLMSSTN